jgi:hypothetical protein
VTGLALSPNTVVYYYTYGSVLAALSRPKANNCPEAMTVLAEVKAAYGGDRDIGGIVAAGEDICRSLGGTSSSTSGSQPGVTPEPGVPTKTPYVVPTINPNILNITPTIIP